MAGAPVGGTTFYDPGDGSNAYIQRVIQVDPSDGTPLGSAPFVTVNTEITKTGAGDTTAYTAKDVFDAAAGAGATFTGLARANGGSGVIVKARLTTDQKTNVARWRLHLFNTAPTFINDNLPFLYLYANEARYQGAIDFDAMATEDATNSTAAYTQRVGNLLPFVCDAASKSLIGILEVLDGFTPTSAQKVSISLTASR